MMKPNDKQRSLAELKTTKREQGFGDSKFQSSMINNPMMYSKIAKLQETGQTYFQKKEIEKERLEQLNEEIRVASILLEEKRKEIMEKKRSPKDDNPIRLEKKMKAMHLKIDNIRNKYNFSDSTNRDLKEEINKLRREINLYKQIQKILTKRTANARKAATEQSEDARDQDRKFEEGTKTLYKHQSEYQFQKKRYDKEFQSVYHVLGEENRDQRKREKFGIKAADGSVMKSQSPWSKSGSDFFKSHAQGFQDAIYDKHGSKSQHNKKHDKKPDGGHNLEMIKQELEKHDDVFLKLVESCVGEKLDLRNEDRKRRNQIEQEYLRKIINTFADYEDQKNTIYTYINSLRDETEQLEKQKKEIEDEIDKYKKLPEQIKKDPKVQKCFEIEKQIEAVRKKRQKMDIEHKRLMLYINQLKMQIPVVFEKIGCDSEEYTREIGEEYGPFNYKDIDESNIIQYLGILEKRTNDLLQLQNQAFNNGKQTLYSDQRKQKYAEESNLSLSNIGGKTKDEDLLVMLENFKNKSEDTEKDKFMYKFEDFQENAQQVYEGLKNKKKKIEKK